MPPNPKDQPVVLTGARQTMLSWARVIDGCDDLPQAYQDFFRAHLAKGRPFPYCVLTPGSSGHFGAMPEKLICEIDEALVVLENSDQQIRVQTYPIHALQDVEFGMILLFSWITVHGQTQDGLPSATTLAFNTATVGRFTPLLNHIRPAPKSLDEDELAAQRAQFAALGRQNFKFMNYAADSLAAGEKALDQLYQPEMRRPTLNLPGWPFTRTITIAHLTVLTNQELILIRDDERSRLNRGMRYGGVWRYIPRRNLASITWASRPDGLLDCAFNLTRGGHVERIFSADQAPALAHLQNLLLDR